MNYKNIHIGTHIKTIAETKNLSISRACIYLKCNHQNILDMYNQQTMDSELLLKWSKLLEYNFFMFYHTHLQLYAPVASVTRLNKQQITHRKEYVFKKNLYMPEIIDWFTGKLERNEITVKEIMDIYRIPRTTIYRWKKKSKTNSKVKKKIIPI